MVTGSGLLIQVSPVICGDRKKFKDHEKETHILIYYRFLCSVLWINNYNMKTRYFPPQISILIALGNCLHVFAFVLEKPNLYEQSQASSRFLSLKFVHNPVNLPSFTLILWKSIHYLWSSRHINEDKEKNCFSCSPYQSCLRKKSEMWEHI